MALTDRDLVVPPIVVDLGKTKRGKIKELKRGGGKLADEVRDVVARVRDDLGATAEGKQLIPIVIIYKRKSKKRRRRRRGLGLPFSLPALGF
jgi:hypothetical protein